MIMRCAKRLSVNELKEYNIPKLIDVLSFVDNLFLTLTVEELQDIFKKVILHEKLFSI